MRTTDTLGQTQNNKMIKEQLDKPFPFLEKNRHRIFVSFLFSVSVFAILIVFQPFGLDDIQYYKPVFIAGFMIITLIVLLFHFFIAPKFLNRFYDFDKWTVKKEIISIFTIITVISVLNWLYNSTVGKDITEQYNLFIFLFITISVGFFPTILLVILVERFFNKKHENIAQNITNKIQHEQKNKTRTIKILSENKTEEINIKLEELICIKSEGNYATVYYFEDNKISKQLIRNSLTKLMEQLIIFDNIKRCHRSYIVNFNNIEKISGNARNYNLHIASLDFTVPVSRNFPKTILDKYSN